MSETIFLFYIMLYNSIKFKIIKKGSSILVAVELQQEQLALAECVNIRLRTVAILDGFS